MRSLYRSAATWTALGLASGLAYREITKANDFSGYTQLAVVHTHTLTLGALFFLLLLPLTTVFRLDQDTRLRWVVIVWNAGLTITAGSMLVKGTMQVLGKSAADSPAIAGVAGLGHMTLTAAFIILFIVLRSGVIRAEQERGSDDVRREPASQ